MAAPRRLELWRDLYIGLDFCLYSGPRWSVLERGERLRLLQEIVKRRPLWSLYDVAALLKPISLYELRDFCPSVGIALPPDTCTKAGKRLERELLHGMAREVSVPRSYIANVPSYDPGHLVCAASEAVQCAEVFDFGHGIKKRCGHRAEEGSPYCGIHRRQS